MIISVLLLYSVDVKLVFTHIVFMYNWIMALAYIICLSCGVQIALPISKILFSSSCQF